MARRYDTKANPTTLESLPSDWGPTKMLELLHLTKDPNSYGYAFNLYNPDNMDFVEYGTAAGAYESALTGEGYDSFAHALYTGTLFYKPNVMASLDYILGTGGTFTAATEGDMTAFAAVYAGAEAGAFGAGGGGLSSISAPSMTTLTSFSSTLPFNAVAWTLQIMPAGILGGNSAFDMLSLIHI